MNIIITGAGKGIGFELVRQLAADPGHKIIAISRNVRQLQTINERSSNGTVSLSPIVPFSFDLVNGDFGDLKSFLDLYFHEVDVLVNNAGYMLGKPLEQLTDTDFDTIFNTNVKAVFRLVQLLIPMMRPGSHILNIGSMGGFQGSQKFSGLSLYSASKGALAVLTECMAEELKNREIKVNCLALGAAQTEMFSEAFPGYRAPLSAAEMAGFIKDFALRGQRYFNGKIIPLSLSTP